MPRDMEAKKKQDQEEKSRWERFIAQEGALERFDPDQVKEGDDVIYYDKKPSDKEDK